MKTNILYNEKIFFLTTMSIKLIEGLDVDRQSLIFIYVFIQFIGISVKFLIYKTTSVTSQQRMWQMN